MSSQIEITINGRGRKIEAGQTLTDLLSSLDLDVRSVVVELNREIVRRPELDDTMVDDGDTIELVHFVGGG